MFKITIAPQAKRQLRLIPKQYKAALSSVIDELKEDPFSGKALIRELTGRFAYRIGPFRMIYKVNKKDKIVNIITVGHRSKVYK